MTPLTKFIGLVCLIFFVVFMSLMIVVPIVDRKKALKELGKNNKEGE